MVNGIEDAGLEGMKRTYLNFLKCCDTARTDYETSKNKPPGLLEEIRYYESKIKRFEERLRKHGISPESIFSKKNGNPKTVENTQQYANDVICQTC